MLFAMKGQIQAQLEFSKFVTNDNIVIKSKLISYQSITIF